MKMRLLSIATLGAFAIAASGAIAMPVKLSKAQLDNVVAGKITQEHVNNGGQTPNGQANGVPTQNVNPTGKAPPGQNK